MLLPCSIQAMTKTKTSNAGSALIQTATGLFQSRWACWKKFYIYKLQIHVMLRARYLLGHLFLLKRNAAFQWILKQTEDSHTARILFTIFSACLVSGNWSSPEKYWKNFKIIQYCQGRRVWKKTIYWHLPDLRWCFSVASWADHGKVCAVL